MEDIQLFKQSYEEAKKSQPDLEKLELIGIAYSCQKHDVEDALDQLKCNELLKKTTHIFGINIQPSDRGQSFCYGDAYKPRA